MTFENFELIIDDCFKELKALSATKGTEYANSDDRLANFKRVAGDVEITPIKAAWVYFRKHLDAINYVIKGKKERSESFKSRIYDAILYLLLIYAIHEESLEARGFGSGPIEVQGGAGSEWERNVLPRE